jgi:hypothetical protein
MIDPPPNPDYGTDVGPTRGPTTNAQRRGGKVFGTMVLVKVFKIIVVLFLLRELQIELGIATALLVLLHVAAAALVVYKLRGTTLHGRRKQHE